MVTCVSLPAGEKTRSGLRHQHHMSPSKRERGPGKGPVTARNPPTPTAAQGPSPAATEKQQVLHGWGGGVRVLACDEVAVQHDMHRIGLAGCRGPPRTRASGKATRRHGSRPPPALLGL